jgi:hypothetical protein
MSREYRRIHAQTPDGTIPHIEDVPANCMKLDTAIHTANAFFSDFNFQLSRLDV